eukprot:CAMPEP_0180821148 /NCGR_PEP_ID=MMETSP1038_2-20121128/70675_1 /TAXON_ID=632150 /ORGANISM="Azadinium spinosum, Strain 3D9" /LENGTH=139 /DNA_ID=CAMNT_0022863309 /DNA_START=12 /DNA_END=426 /DNA_ORIENTATION=+
MPAPSRHAPLSSASPSTATGKPARKEGDVTRVSGGSLDTALVEVQEIIAYALREKLDVAARIGPARTPSPLLHGGLRAPLRHKHGHPHLVVIITDTVHAEVNDGADAGHRQRGLGNICRQHHTPLALGRLIESFPVCVL